MTSVRDEAIHEFLSAAGWGDADRQPLAGDASFRRYERLRCSTGATVVLMDAPPETGEDAGRFAAVTEYLRRAGLAAPEVLADDLEQGFLLLEDLGDNIVARVLGENPDPELEAECYGYAVELLRELRANPPPAELTYGGRSWPIHPYDQQLLWREAKLLTDWWLPAATGAPVVDTLVDEYRGLLETTWQRIADDRSALVLRDFHAENLVWLPERQPPQRIGLLDYQDAVAGHPAYDLVSLIEDARRDVSPRIRAGLVPLFFLQAGYPPDGGARFETQLAVFGAQRNLKIIGIFARLWLRDGKPNYLNLLPRVWNHLQRDLQQPALVELRRWVSANVPEPSTEILARVRNSRQD